MTREEMIERVADLVRFNKDPIAIAEEAVSIVLKEAAAACIQNASVWQQVIAWNRSKSERHIGIAFEAHVAEEIGKFYAAAILALAEEGK